MNLGLGAGDSRNQVAGASKNDRSVLKRTGDQELREQPENKKSKTKTAVIKSPSLQIYTGTIPQILQAAKTNPSQSIIYETYGRIVSVNPGRHNCERNILLRSVDGTGPLINGVFNEIDLSLSPSCRTSQVIRCMGRFESETNRFQIIKIGPTNQSFIDSVNRLNSFSNFAIIKR